MTNGEQILKAKDLKSKLKEIDKDLIKLKVVGYSKNKLVTCEMNGKLIVNKFNIDSSLITIEHKTLLEESISEAFKKALTDAQTKIGNSFLDFSNHLKND